MLVAFLTSMALSALVLMLAFPLTPTGKWLHRILVEAPARFLMDFTWAKLGQALISLAVLLFLISIGPEGVALLTAAGADAALLEVMLAMWLASASGTIAGTLRTIARVGVKSLRTLQAMLTPRNRQRAPRRRKIRPQRDEGDEPGWAFA